MQISIYERTSDDVERIIAFQEPLWHCAKYHMYIVAKDQDSAMAKLSKHVGLRTWVLDNISSLEKDKAFFEGKDAIIDEDWLRYIITVSKKVTNFLVKLEGDGFII